MAKVNNNRKKEMIRTKLSAIIRKYSSNPKFENVSISNVKISPDSAAAVIYYSVFMEDVDTDDLTKSLNSAAGFFQAKLAATLKTRNTPKLSFVYDPGFDHADKISQILNGLEIKEGSEED